MIASLLQVNTTTQAAHCGEAVRGEARTATAMAQSNKLVLDGAAWASNVLSSVFIIFVNKILMSKTGYKFQYGKLLPD